MGGRGRLVPRPANLNRICGETRSEGTGRGRSADFAEWRRRKPARPRAAADLARPHSDPRHRRRDRLASFRPAILPSSFASRHRRLPPSGETDAPAATVSPGKVPLDVQWGCPAPDERAEDARGRRWRGCAHASECGETGRTVVYQFEGGGSPRRMLQTCSGTSFPQFEHHQPSASPPRHVHTTLPFVPQVGHVALGAIDSQAKSSGTTCPTSVRQATFDGRRA